MMRLLIAEDDEVLRRELSRDLESHGYETAVPERFEDVEDIVKEGKVHLVLLDVTLPGRDGYEICRSIRRFSRIPILFLTSRDTDMDELYGMTMGGDDFVRKPYKMPIPGCGDRERNPVAGLPLTARQGKTVQGRAGGHTDQAGDTSLILPFCPSR